VKSSLQRVWCGLVCVLAVGAAACAESSAPKPGAAPASAQPGLAAAADAAPGAAPAGDAAARADAAATDAEVAGDAGEADAGADGGDDLPRIRMGTLETAAEARPAAPASVAAAVKARTGVRPARPAPRTSTATRPAPATSVASAKEVSAMGTINAHMREVEDCYGRVALKDPSIAGRITLRWTLGRDGVPSAVAVVSDTLKDKSVGACIKERARTWRFPAPAGGLGVVTYPFDLRVM
jgi:hypothetical protein